MSLLAIHAAVVSRFRALVPMDAAPLVILRRGGVIRTPHPGATRIRHMIGAARAGLVLISGPGFGPVFRLEGIIRCTAPQIVIGSGHPMIVGPSTATIV